MSDSAIIAFAEQIIRERGLDNSAKIGQALIALYFTAKNPSVDDLESFLQGVTKLVTKLREVIVAELEKTKNYKPLP